LHDSQGLLGLGCPDAWNAPAIWQTWSQWPARQSPTGDGFAAVGAQLAPSGRLVQDEGLESGSHAWQTLDGLGLPAP
jgi:hypothetical protein